MNGSRVVPLIETARLRLREFRRSDLGPQAEALRDIEVVRYLTGQPHSREETWRKLATGVGMWALLGYGYWCVERREDGCYLGQLGFADFKRDMAPSIEGIPEIGWVFARQAHGQGYAREAVAAAIAWAEETLGRQQFVALISRGNEASVRLAERSGFSICEQALYKGEPVLLFRRPASPISV